MSEPKTKTEIYYQSGILQAEDYKFRDYFLIVLIILYEDSPFFLLNSKQIFWFVIFCLLLILNFKKKILFNKRILILMLSVWLLILFQYFIFSGEVTPAVLYKPILIFYTPYLVFTLMGLKYFRYLFNIIFFVAVYTFIIYLLQHLVPPFNELLTRAYHLVLPYSWMDPGFTSSILIYTEPSDSGFFLMRNAGIFHEPGAYSIYLMLAIVLNTYFTRRPLNGKNAFLMVVLLTTFSTAGYIMLFIFLFYTLVKSRINLGWKSIILVPFMILVLWVYRDTKFLKQKTEGQLENETELVEKNEKSQRGRFYAFGMSMNAFLDSPVTGQGILYQHRYDVGSGGSFGYGFAGLFAMFGLFFGLFYMWKFYDGFVKMSRIFRMTGFYALIVFVLLNLGLLTQVFFFNSAFQYFFMVGLYLPSGYVALTPGQFNPVNRIYNSQVYEFKESD